MTTIRNIEDAQKLADHLEGDISDHKYRLEAIEATIQLLVQRATPPITALEVTQAVSTARSQAHMASGRTVTNLAAPNLPPGLGRAIQRLLG